MARMMPEALMTAIVCCWLIILVNILYRDEQVINSGRYSLIFGALFAISLADKLNFMPFFVLPLFVLSGWRNKLKYALYSLVFFMVFAFPVTLNHRIFVSWVSNMATHTGAYGGDTGSSIEEFSVI
jgi:hypothetical protein